MSAKYYRLIPLMVLLLGLICYLPGIGGPVIFDSVAAISKNPYLSFDSASFAAWLQATLSSDSGLLKRPLSMLSLAFNFQLLPEQATIFIKLTNVLIHLLIGGLFYQVTLLLCRELQSYSATETGTSRALALLAAGIWLLHPLHVTSVLYAVQRMTQLSTFFSLLAVYIYLRYRPSLASAAADRSSLVQMLTLVGLCTLFATLSKENGLLIPYLLLVIEFVIFNFKIAGIRSKRFQKIAWVLVAVPILIALTLIILPPDFMSSGYAGRNFTQMERLLTESRVLWLYIGWVILPDLSSMGFHHDDILISTSLIAPWTTLLALLGWLIALAVALFKKNTWPFFSLAVLWFLVGHSMESSLLPLELVYEHRNYLPVMGICLFMAGLIMRLVSVCDTQQVRVVISMAPLIALAILLFVRASYWSDELTLSSVNLRNHPDSYRSTYHFANVSLRRADKLPASEEKYASMLTARSHYEKMLEIAPDDLVALIALLYIENRYFLGVDSNQIGQRLLKAANKNHLHAGEINALSLLTDCSVFDWCKISDSTYLMIMETILAQSRFRAEVYYQLAKHYAVAKKDLPLAIDYAQKSLVVNPGKLNTWFELASWQAQLGQKGAALLSLSHMLAEDKRYSRLHQATNAFK